MKISRLLPIVALTACAVVSSQCAMYEQWVEDLGRARNPEIVKWEPVPMPLTPQLSVMPVVTPVKGRLVSESTYAFGGRTFLEQRVVVRESPLETELRITQIQ
jgi:hypothetical protein